VNNSEFKGCDDCGYHWIGGVDGYQRCPQCDPDQPKPLAERLVDRNEHMGPQYVWDECRGPRGRWVKLGKEAFVFPSTHVDDLRELEAALRGWGIEALTLRSGSLVGLATKKLRELKRKDWQRERTRLLSDLPQLLEGALSADELEKVFSAKLDELQRLKDS
jgi:hypothetical protein